MLRCPPSRINLTSSDISNFERRFVARRTGVSAPLKASKVQISPGPARSTSLSIVTAEQNIGRKRAASSSSEATLYTADGQEVDTTPQSGDKEQGTRVEAAIAVESVVHSPNAHSQSSPRRQIDSYYAAIALTGLDETIQSSIESLSGVDGTTAPAGPHSPVEVRCGFHVNEPTIPPPEIVDDILSAPQLLCSARARRRHGRNHDQHIPGHALGVTEPSTDKRTTVPDIVLQQDSDPASANPALDPGAPAFVPRIRFGTATGSSIDFGVQIGLKPRWSSVDSTLSSANLRIRSSFERNSDLPLGSGVPFNGPSGSSNSHTHFHRERENASRRQRQRRRTTDESTSTANLTANLDRYPLLRPPSTVNANRRSSRVGSHNITRAQNIRQLSSSASRLEVRNTSIRQSEDGVPTLHVGTRTNEGGIRLGLPSRTHAGNNLSTPNLLHRPLSPERIYGRRSSLHWNRSGSPISSNYRVPSMVSAASGISGSSAVTRQTSSEGLDAASEALRMRNSPLDDLTERLSRLAASQPRSVGRSWERPPSGRPRVSLIAGDPFRRESRPSAEARRETILLPLQAVNKDDTEHGASDEVDATAEELVALSLALPPSSPLPSSPPAIPRTPTATQAASASPLPIDNGPAATNCASPPSCIKRKPVPKTPRLPVYDDSKPPGTRPQTLAGVRRSTRRAKARSEDTTSRPSPHTTSRVKMGSPPTIPERHPHRNTFPSTSSNHRDGDAIMSGNPENVAAVRLAEGTPLRGRRGRTQAYSIDDRRENDFAGHLPGLESDRRVWEGRQESGTLEVTPPRTGRFEQYMS